MKWDKVIIDNVLKYEQPTRYIVETEDYDDKFPTPVLTAGKSFLLGYTNEEENIFNDVPVIIFDDFTTSFQYVDFPFKVKSSAMKILKPVKEKADLKFLFYKMQTIKFEAGEHKRYWISKYSQQEIPLPPLSVQKAIADKLDKADALRKKDQQLLKHYDDLAQSVFIDMFGDPVKNERLADKRLSEVVEINPKKSEIADIAKDTVVSFLEMASISENGEIKYMEERPLSDVWSGFTYFSEKDVLFAKITPCMENGKGAVARQLTNGLGFGSTEFHILRPIPNFSNSYWIYGLTKNSSFRKLAEKNMSGSAGQKRVSKNFLENFKVKIPPLPLQQKFAGIIENIELQKQKVKLQAQESENLFQALLQESFN